MKNLKRRKIAAIAVAVALIAALMIGGTISYLSDSSETVTNTFTPNTNSVALTETTGDEYDIVPGTYSTKNPTVTATMTLPSFIYLVVYDDSDGLVEYEVVSNWVKLYDVDDEENYTGGTVYYQYYGGTGGTETYQVLKDNKVYYSAELTNEDMYDKNGDLLSNLTLSFQAYIIQAAGFITSSSSGPDYAASAKNAFYYAFYNINTDDEDDISFVDDETELTEALSDIEDGAYIILTDNVETEDAITIAAADDVTIDLAGNTLETDSIYITNSGNDYSEGVVITSSQDGAVLSTTNSTYAILACYGDIEEISNITIDASDATYGIYVNGSNAGVGTIENVTIENATYGIYAYKVSTSEENDAISTISGCTIEDCTYGIWITSSYIDLIEDCDITGTKYGIYMRASESSYTTGANIEDSTITGGSDALVMDCYGSSESVISANLTSCTLIGTNYAIEYNLYFTIDLTLTNCTIGSTTGSYSLNKDASGGTGTYKQVTADDLTTSTETDKEE